MTDWSRLYTEGRCKAIGVPWTDEEAHAAHVLKIPVAYVRQGVLTQEAYEKALGKQQATQERTKRIQLIHLKRSQLIALCAQREILTTDEATRPVLIEMLLDNGCPKSIAEKDVPSATEED
jgi:hypothetical protein